MRLITRRVYRAFPELDRYDDARCVRFVKAARGSLFRQGARGLILFAVGVAGVVGSIALMGLAERVLPAWVTPFEGPAWRRVLVVIAMALAIAPGLLAVYLLRDWLLRRRVRWVLRTRGVCAECWYVLVGLPVGPGNRVTCPECGHETEVDPSLGELVLDDAGFSRFQPEQTPRIQGFWTPRRKRAAKRALAWGTGGLVVATLLGFGAYEVFLRVQARTARAARVGTAGLTAFVRQYEPADAAETGNAWEAFDRAAAKREAINQELWFSDKKITAHGTPIEPRFEALYSNEPETGLRMQDTEFVEASVVLARRLIAEYETQGVFADLKEVARRRGVVRPFELGPDEAPIGLLLPYLGKARGLARVCAARTMESLRAGDREKTVESLEAMFAMARIAHHQPVLIEGLVAVAIESLALNRAVDVLTARPEWAADVAAAMERQRADVLPEHHLLGERIWSQDMIAWVFEKPGRVRFGRFSPELNDVLHGVQGPVGTFAGNWEQYTQAVDAAAAAAKLELWRRRNSTVPAAPPATLAIASALSPAFGRSQQSMDQIEMQRRGVSLMIAIEQWKASHGTCPDTLAQLAPEVIESIPVDPWTGKAFGYRKVDPSEDPWGRAYLVYSFGSDGVDDGGNTSSKKHDVLWKATGDYVVNEPTGLEKRSKQDE